MLRSFFSVLFLVLSLTSFAQGVGIPTEAAGIGFGNLPMFSGMRFNYADKRVKKIRGINITIWQTKHDSLQTGSMSGLSLGLPLAIGTDSRTGVSIGALGTGAKSDMKGVSVGGLGVGAGGNLKGINLGGLGIGAGGSLTGINIGGLGAGSGGSVAGINLGGLGIGAGGDLTGLTFGGLGAGAGDDVKGVIIGGLGVGAGGDVKGLSISGVGLGAGGQLKGINIAGIGLGAGAEVSGLAIAGVGVASPKLNAIVIAPAAATMEAKGLMVTPVYLQVGGSKARWSDSGESAGSTFKGIAISAYNNIRGEQKGLSIGVFNYADHQKGFQLGLLNYVKDNPKGLRLLPIFNTRFARKQTAKD